MPNRKQKRDLLFSLEQELKKCLDSEEMITKFNQYTDLLVEITEDACNFFT